MKAPNISFDELVQYVQSLPSTQLYAMAFEPGGAAKIMPWMTLENSMIVEDVVFRPSIIHEQMSALPLLIAKYGRWHAQQLRIYETAERLKRVWKASRFTEILAADDDAKATLPSLWAKDAKGNWKAPSATAIEAYMPAEARYTELDDLCAGTREATNVLETVLKALNAKERMITAYPERVRGS